MNRGSHVRVWSGVSLRQPSLSEAYFAAFQPLTLLYSAAQWCRREAVRLDRKRFRKLKRAAALYSEESHFEGKLLLDDAKRLKQLADREHRWGKKL